MSTGDLREGPTPWKQPSRLPDLLVIAGAMLVALGSARPYAGGWNDGSRLAAVECIVDYQTLVIDRSIFVEVPSDRNPYLADGSQNAGILKKGTGDKLLIGGHYYSDKSPVPALLLALVYGGLQWATGLTAQARPELFCYLMTVASSGLAYVVAVYSLYRLGRPLQLPTGTRLALALSFAISTLAVVYVRHVNNHMMLLGVAAPLLLQLACFGEDCSRGQAGVWRLLGLGSLAGLGYTIDLGVGPVLLAFTLVLVAWRCPSLKVVLFFSLAALPWLLLHHCVNFGIGGTFKPANAVPEYLQWPGSSFTAQNMTGVMNHQGIVPFLSYAASMLFGKRGFFGHNLPLFLLLPALVCLMRHRTRELPELLFAFSWFGGTWLAYALTSNNSSGQCCSIRWLVPLLAGAYYVLAVFLRHYPGYRGDLLILSGFGMVLMGIAWRYGPWLPHMVPGFWPIQAAALTSWLGFRIWQQRKNRAMPVRAG